MRTIQLALIIQLVLVLPAAFGVGCASEVPPTVTFQPSYSLDAKTPIFVSAPRERARVVQSLEKAGFQVTEKRADTPYFLVAKVGRARSTRDCGVVANVSYDLRDGGRRIAVVKGRGATGSCEPNILDDMSAKLAGMRD